MRFVLRMAWRDFRARPSRFLLYAFAIALGVGSLTAIESFRRALEASIDGQGRNLLGADLLVRAIRPFTPEQQQLVERWSGPKTTLISYRTMLLVPETGATRLVEVQAIEPEYPFYGRLSTDPESAAETFQARGEVLLDEVLMKQVEVEPGDVITLGGRDVRVAGALRQTPGEIPARALVAPRVLLPLVLVEPERFERPGMMARFEWYLAHGDDSPLAVRGLNALAQEAARLGLDVETVAGRREQLLGNSDRISRYLGLMGFSALVIGCLGAAGAVHFFVQSKRLAVAQLRCLGASLFHAAGSFFIQLLALAIVGATVGVALGMALAGVLPALLAPFVPVPVETVLRGDAAAASWWVGGLFTVLAGLLPITRLRRISPLLSLRLNLPPVNRLDAAGIAAVMVLAGALLVFAAGQLGSWRLAGLYLGGVVAVLLLLALTGLLLRRLCRVAVRPGWSYTFRMAVGGLYRPQNQTALLVICIGMGVFLLNTVDVLEQHLRQDVDQLDHDRPNLAMIDIQPDQRAAFLDLLRGFQPSSVYAEPMITMRLVSINGIGVDALERDPARPRANWALKREFRTTYRNHRKPAIETVIAGAWVEERSDGSFPVPVSLEQGIAEALAVGVGDHLVFDIHGELFETKVENLRAVDWKSMQPNFFVIFPEGAIDEAPQSILVFSEIADLDRRAAFQAAVARQFPNVTTIDISLMMNTVSAMLGQLSVAVRSIAWMTLLAGFLVLLAILRAGRQQRLREAVLLRTLGAPARLVVRGQALEFLLLALGALVSGLALSWAASGLIVHYGMKLPFAPDWWSPWRLAVPLVGAIYLMGWLNGRAALKKRPAEAWREWSMASS
ncbi:MAG TPA: ABC transporter permease [Kiritimatiellia bacterium]|nr:ABC transporter permease [Kiritimatiellia bacterium]HMO97705.1 ABC transporter permease [Kiritimatiellia bacterium]HMP97969.1 ABC transporter permease [Kiritimatiellia bacterium]